MRLRLGLASTLLFFAGFACHKQANLKQILNNPHVWGKNFPSVLAELQGWSALGEVRINVLGDRTVGERKYEAKDTAQSLSERLLNEITENQSHEFANISRLFKSDAATGDSFVLPRENEPRSAALFDGQIAVALKEAPLSERPQMLAPNLTASVLTKELGEPQSVVHRIVRSKFESRSEVINVYSYSDQTVQFIESNYSASLPGTNERLIERAVLDVARVKSELDSKQ
jgi:hypothetical protein